MIGSEWRNADGTIIQIAGEADPMEGGWAYRFVSVRGARPGRGRKTKTISDPVLRQHYVRIDPRQGGEVIR